MKSWLFFTAFALVLLVLFNNKAPEEAWKPSAERLTNDEVQKGFLSRLKKGSRLLIRERIVYETELAIETDPIVDSGDIFGDGRSQELMQQKITPSRALSSAVESPGIVLRTTRKAYDYWIPVVLKFAKTAALQVVHIPPITKKKFNFRVTVKDLRVSEADISLVNYQIAAPNILTFSLANGRMVLDGGYKAKVEFPPATKHGSITITLSDVSIRFTVELSKNPQGILQAQIRQCSSSVGSIKIRVGNEIVKRVFNFYKGEFKSSANQQLCPSLGQLMNIANSALVKHTTFYNLPSGLKFDYSLIKNPEAHDSFLDFELRGTTESAEAEQTLKTSFGSALLSSITDAPKRMAVVFIYDFVFNSFLSRATKAGLFNEVHLEKMHSSVKEVLRLSCADGEQCVGKLAPNMSNTFMDNTGELILKIETSPTVTISQQTSATLRFDLKFELRYQQRTFQFLLDAAAPTTVLTFDLSATVNITTITIRKASLTQNNATATAHIESISTSNVQPRVEAIKTLAQDLPIVLKLAAKTKLPQALSKGIMFSTGKVVSFDLDVSFQDHVLILDTDVMKV